MGVAFVVTRSALGTRPVEPPPAEPHAEIDALLRRATRVCLWLALLATVIGPLVAAYVAYRDQLEHERHIASAEAWGVVYHDCGWRLTQRAKVMRVVTTVLGPALPFLLLAGAARWARHALRVLSAPEGGLEQDLQRATWVAFPLALLGWCAVRGLEQAGVRLPEPWWEVLLPPGFTSAVGAAGCGFALAFTLRRLAMRPASPTC